MATFADLNDKIDFCFDTPTKAPAAHVRGTLASVLYLLRRELIETAGYDPAAGDSEQEVYDGGVKNRLFATLIVTMTGFDLLAKFQFGDKNGEVGKRFLAFLTSPDGGEKDRSRRRSSTESGIRSRIRSAFRTRTPSRSLE